MIYLHRYINNLLFISIFVCGAASCTLPHENEVIHNGLKWRDTDGNFINAHGGCILYHDSIYYWYGEYKGDSTYRLDWVKTWECWRTEAGGISCYSSRDLVNWKFEGLVLQPVHGDTASDLHPSKVIERPKVVFNEKTRKFVMWLHIESPDYEKAHSGVAVGDKPNAMFTYLGSFRPDGTDSRDQTLFKDDDGRAYQISSSEWNTTLNIHLLNDEYTKPTGIFTRNFINESREAPAVFKHQDKYYMITSGCTGWDPNSAQYAMADSMLGVWTNFANPCSGKNAELTFKGQCNFVLPVAGKKDVLIAMFDKWEKTDLDNSGYIWLPVIFKGDSLEIPWMKKWKAEPFL